MGTRRLRAPTAADTDETDLTDSSIATIYWNREDDDGYKAALDLHRRHPEVVRDPARESLYNFASLYTLGWKFHGAGHVPHVIPGFKSIPRRDGQNKERYLMFLRALLLVHKPGTTFTEVSALEEALLETEASDFSMSEECPSVIAEEFEQSQKDGEGDDAEGMDVDIADEEDLLVQPEFDHGPHVQEDWQECLDLMAHHEAPHVEDGQGDYEEALDINTDFDWQEDSRLLHLSEEDKSGLQGWLHMTKRSEGVEEDNSEVGGEPEDLNPKQRLAYDIICNYIDGVIADPENTPQLLMNISGAAGTGKSFWLNTVRRFVKSKPELHQNFIRSAAPSGTAAFLIGGETLHGLLSLPCDTPFKPLSTDKQAILQLKFEHVGLIVIDEKSMIGQKQFYYVNKRLQEARPAKADQPFGGMSIVLLGDWKQLPPVKDTPLYQDPSELHGKTAKARKKELEKKSLDKGLPFKAQAYQFYRKFDKSVIFTKVQRQDGDDQAEFREELKRLGEGTFTQSDWMRWQCRTLDALPLAERNAFHERGILACARKKDMVAHNQRKVRELQQPIALIKANNNPKSEGNKEGEQGGLPNNIILCKGTKFRLTANLWTAAGLTNGAKGTVHSIIYMEGEKPPALPVAVIAVFDKYYGAQYEWREELNMPRNAIPMLVTLSQFKTF